MPQYAHSLNKIVDSAINLKQVRKSGLRFGDRVIINTQNSIYFLKMLSDGSNTVCGGWFDKQGLSPMKIGIRGCTWGGSMIKMDILAACGLCLEFGNRVVTSPIKKIFVFPDGSEN